MKEFRFYYNGLRTLNAINMDWALLQITSTYRELGKLTKRELIKTIKIIQL